MVDVVAPIHPEPLLIVLQRRPHLRRKAYVEEVLDDEACERRGGAAFRLGQRLEFPGHDCGNPCGYEFQLLGSPLSHALLSSMQLARGGRARILARRSTLAHQENLESNAVVGETVSAFIPDPPPPANPPLSMDAATSDLLRSAEQKLSRRDLAGEMVPSIECRARSGSRSRWDSCVSLVHVQFQSIHTYLDGNGRIGRLLISKPTAAKAVSVLERLGMLKETTGRRRDRTYGYSAYMERLRAGTDLEP